VQFVMIIVARSFPPIRCRSSCGSTNRSGSRPSRSACSSWGSRATGKFINTAAAAAATLDQIVTARPARCCFTQAIRVLADHPERQRTRLPTMLIAACLRIRLCRAPEASAARSC